MQGIPIEERITKLAKQVVGDTNAKDLANGLLKRASKGNRNRKPLRFCDSVYGLQGTPRRCAVLLRLELKPRAKYGHENTQTPSRSRRLGTTSPALFSPEIPLARPKLSTCFSILSLTRGEAAIHENPERNVLPPCVAH